MQNAITYCTELVFSNGKGTPTHFYDFLSTNQLQRPSSESAALSPLEQAVTMTAKGVRVDETPETAGK